jgi:tetratricopeptide (TPR) repeat protein
MAVIAALLFVLPAQEGPSELLDRALREGDLDRREALYDRIVREHPDSPEAATVREFRRVVRAPDRRPGILDALASFLFGTILGWWILLLGVFVLSLPLVHRYRAWLSLRRFMRAQGERLANPQNADARFQLAEIHLQAGRWKPAARYAGEAIAIASENPLFDGIPYAYLRCLGEARYGSRDYAGAEETFERALKAKSEMGYGDALLGLAKARYRLGRLEGALEFAKHAVAEQQSMLEAYFRWAQAAAALGRPDEVAAARQQFRRVAAGLPRFAHKKRLRWRLAFLAFPLSCKLI